MKDYKKLQNGSDIRGVALEGVEGEAVNLTPQAAADLAKGFSLWLDARLQNSAASRMKPVVAIGRDSRLSGPALLKACADALSDAGKDVLDCGMASTPAMFMSTVFEQTQAAGAIMITASHLPFNRNGLKFFTRDGGLEKEDIKAIIAYAQQEELPCSEYKGRILPFDLMSVYSEHLRTIICQGLGAEEASKPLAGMKITVDAGNGAGGFYATQVLEPLGADVSSSQFLEPDGSFPNHQPNPENKAAMDSISARVKECGTDLGIIFDTDVDRAAAVDSTGKDIARNGIVALAAVLASEGHPGTTIVTDSITSSQLKAFLENDLGLKHYRFKRGYRNVINKGIELNNQGIDCQLAIETSGHAALKENYFLDDGAYLATKIVIKAAQLKKEGKGIETCIAAMEEPAEAKEFRMSVNTEDFAAYADTVLEGLKTEIESGAEGLRLELPNYEGVRVAVDPAHGDGWFLIRKSLHDPLMPMNIESNAVGGVETIKKITYQLLSKYELLGTEILK